MCKEVDHTPKEKGIKPQLSRAGNSSAQLVVTNEPKVELSPYIKDLPPCSDDSIESHSDLSSVTNSSTV